MLDDDCPCCISLQAPPALSLSSGQTAPVMAGWIFHIPFDYMFPVGSDDDVTSTAARSCEQQERACLTTLAPAVDYDLPHESNLSQQLHSLAHIH